VPWVHLHSFRHTCASLLFDGGMNIAQVSKWLGHSKPAFTLDVYTHLMDDGLGDPAFLDAAMYNPASNDYPHSAGNGEAFPRAETAG
jgi:hypothetical protein